MEYVANHSGNGLMADIEKNLHEFQDSYFIQPIRDVRGYLSSEKKKVIRQLMGRGFIGRHVDLPDWVLKRYYGRFFETTLVNWLITLTRSVILKERIGDKYIVYRHEDLVNDTESIMNSIANSIGLEFNDTLLTPTVAHVDWQGNSMYGKQTGINPNLAKVRDVFNSVEVELINKYCGKIIDYMSNLDIGLVDYSGLDRSILLDYDMQQQYYDDRNKTALYFSSMYERWAYRSVLSDTVSSFKMKPKTYFLDL